MNYIQNNSWIEVSIDSDFPLQNIPFGVFRHPVEKDGRCATRIGDTVIDLSQLASLGYFDAFEMDLSVFFENHLNPFIELGKEVTTKVRLFLIDFFGVQNIPDQDERKMIESSFFDAKSIEMMMPIRVGDYTDFYSSIDHATNVGIMFRDPENALFPNWKHLPVGYHGRSSSIVVSGTKIHRPKGQILPQGSTTPIFSPSRTMDFELEMAFIIGKESDLGSSISTSEADEYIFGMLAFNDLSARDIQKWEYVPLGPFLGKNFGSVVSPWIVTLEALEPFRVKGSNQEPQVLPYLQFTGMKNYDIHLDVILETQDGVETVISKSNHKYLYWNMCQQLAHHTINGCNVRVGDLYASGTISGPTDESYGSLLELSWGGTKTIQLKDGTERKFLNDFDQINIHAYCKMENLRIGFGECRTQLLPAKI
jgi:fumarylacetoacetase